MRSSPKRSDDTSHRWNENHHSEVTYSENSTMQQKHHSNSYDMRETARGAQNSVKDDTKYVIENQVRFKYEYQSSFLDLLITPTKMYFILMNTTFTCDSFI